MCCRNYTFLLLLGIFLSACTERRNEFDPEAVSREVLVMLGEYATASNSGDLDAALEFYVQDSRFRWAEDGTIRYSSYTDLETAIRSFADYGDFKTEYSNPIVNALTRDHAHLFTPFKTTVGDGGRGGDADTDRGETGGFSYSGVAAMNLVRIGAGWKIMAGHTSTFRERPTY